MDATESEAVEQSITTQLESPRVMEQQLEVDDGCLAKLGQVAPWTEATELTEPPVSLPLPDRLLARLVSLASFLYYAVTKLLSLVYLFGTFLLKKVRWSWDKMKRAWEGGQDAHADADLINFLTNTYLTDFFSLETSRKVLCIVGPPQDKANETAARLFNFKGTSKHFKHHVQVKLPEAGPAVPATILAEILVQIGISEDHSGKDTNEVIELINKALGPVRYLVLITNLRGAEAWMEIRGAFPENQKCSRVIITTSQLDVAEECSSADSDLIYKVNNTAADGKVSEEGEDEEGVDALLSGSCNACLDKCSLYLSTVKDGDVSFERSSMVRKWVAEELIEEEKMGHEHFLDLLSRGVIQEAREPQRVRAEPAYVVNPRMLPGLRKKSEHGKFAAHIDVGSAEEALTHPMVATCEIPRLSFKCGPCPSTTTTTTTSQQPCAVSAGPKAPAERFFKMMFPTKKKKAAAAAAAEQRGLGSLIRIHAARSMTVHGHGKGLLRKLNGVQLLLLDLQGCKDLDNEDVVLICYQMTGLKYLSINGTPVSEIPKCIKNLHRLETLDLRETKVTVLPPEIYELQRLSHMFLGDWLKMAEGRYAAAEKVDVAPRNVTNSSNPLFSMAVLDIRTCYLAKGDLERLGSMENLRSLALTLVGLPTEEMFITHDLLFEKLRFFALDCHVPWITFCEGAMPELGRLYLRLYAGPRGKTPSGTNHLKKLHEITLSYSHKYEGSESIKETKLAMEAEDTMRARATTIVINGEPSVPQIQVPRHSRQTLGWLVRKLLRGFYDCIPYTTRFRPKLAEWIERRPALAIPLLYLAFFILVALLVKMAPLVIKVAIWLARRALHAAALIFLHQRYGNRMFIVGVPVLAYHLYCIIIILACYVMSPAVNLVSATILGILRLFLVYILTPLGYTLAALVSLLAPLVFAYYLPSLPHYLHSLLQRFFPTLSARFPNLRPPLPKLLLRLSSGIIVFFLRFLLLWLYFSPRLLYSAVTAMLLVLHNIVEWLILGA